VAVLFSHVKSAQVSAFNPQNGRSMFFGNVSFSIGFIFFAEYGEIYCELNNAKKFS
jgi:hypothetical protein